MERKLKIVIISSLVFVALLFVIDSMRSYNSLEEAVQSEWKTPIKVVNHDEKMEVVYYLDYDQHVVDVYQHEVGKYRYNDRQSTGMRFDSDVGLPFYVQAHHFKGVGNVIYGAIETDEHVVEKFVIRYKNGQSQEISATNNTFIAEFPKFLNSDIMMFQEAIDNAIGYDQQGKIVERYY